MRERLLFEYNIRGTLGSVSQFALSPSSWQTVGPRGRDAGVWTEKKRQIHYQFKDLCCRP